MQRYNSSSLARAFLRENGSLAMLAAMRRAYLCPPQQRGELGDVRRESMPSSLCALANKFEHLTSFELFVFTFRERQIPRIAGNAIDAAHDADVTGDCTFHAE